MSHDITWLEPMRSRLSPEFFSVAGNGSIFLSKPLREKLGITDETELNLRARIGVQERTLIIQIVDKVGAQEFGTFPVILSHGVSFNANRYVGMDPGRYRFTTDTASRRLLVDMDSRYDFTTTHIHR